MADKSRFQLSSLILCFSVHPSPPLRNTESSNSHSTIGYAHTNTGAHTCTHRHTHAYTGTHTHTHAHMYAHMHAHTGTHRHAQAHTGAHTCTHRYTHTGTHTGAHTVLLHAPILLLSLLRLLPLHLCSLTTLYSE